MHGLLTAADLPRKRIERLLSSARAHAAGGQAKHPDALVGLAFFEPSLRTRVGFDVAAARLHARTTTIQDAKQTAAMAIPESLADTVRSVAPWLDVLCLRHPDADAVLALAEFTDTPIINCGNGRDEHPTQALIDLFAMLESFGTIDGLRVALVGDLHGMRTAHSLALALSRFDGVYLRCVSPSGLELPGHIADSVRALGVDLDERDALELDGVNVVYIAGLPAPTRIGVLTREQQGDFRLTADIVDGLDEGVRVLCPLPRIDEVAEAVDSRPQAVYFRQSVLGLAMRMAILDEILAAAGR